MWLGTAAAFAVHVAIAVAAGQVLVTVLPPRFKDAVVAVLFAAGAVYLLVTSFRHDVGEGVDAARQGGRPPSLWRVAGMGFVVTFLAEWGDITQITTANLAVRYAEPASVFVGATLGLWAVAALAVSVGAKSLAVIPMPWVRRISAAILLGFAVYSAIQAITRSLRLHKLTTAGPQATRPLNGGHQSQRAEPPHLGALTGERKQQH